MVSLTKRLSYFLMSMMLIVMTVFNTGLTVNAAETCAGPTDIGIKIFLTSKEGTTLPLTVMYKFTVAPGTAVASTATTPEIKPGPSGATISNTSDGTVITKPIQGLYSITLYGNTVYNTVQGTDPINLPAGMQYAKETFYINLSDVTFTEPGIYRWVITLSSVSNNMVAIDTSTVRYLDVYVITDEDGNLSVAPNGCVLHKTTDVFTDGSKPSDLPSNADTDTNDGGNNSFISHIGAYDYTISTTTTGNQGYKKTYFKYDVTITSTASSTYTVDIVGATANPTVNGTPQTNPTTITTTATYYLKDSEQIVIKNLLKNDKVAVKVEALDYTAKYSHNGASQVTSSKLSSKTVGTQDNTLVWELNRSGTVPTGVFLNMMPWPILLLIAAAFLAYSQWRKARNRSQLM